MADPQSEVMNLITAATNSGDAKMRLLERRFTGELPRDLPSPKSLTFEAHNRQHREGGDLRPEQVIPRRNTTLDPTVPARSGACATV